MELIFNLPEVLQRLLAVTFEPESCKGLGAVFAEEILITSVKVAVDVADFIRVVLD